MSELVHFQVTLHILDERGKETVEEVTAMISPEELYDITRIPLSHMYSLNKLLWIRKNRREIEEQADKYLMFGDFINYKLTGKRMIDPSSASRTSLLDVRERKWSEKIAGRFHIPLEKFSEVQPTGTNMGTILPEIARQTGLSGDIEVILGCHDQCSALLGAGCINCGDIAASEGSSESINLLVDSESYDKNFYEQKLCFEPFIEENSYMVPVGFLSHGTSIRWFLDKFGADFGKKEIEDRYERADSGCPEDCGDLFCIPYLSSVKTRDTKNQTKGCFVGLDFSCGTAQMYRALLEGLCFESRAGIEILQSMNLKMNSLTAAGGCSKSSVLMQMKADVLKMPVQILESTESGIMGLAAVCAVSDQVYPDYAHAVEKFVKFGRTYHPVKDYDKRFEQYKEIVNKMG